MNTDKKDYWIYTAQNGNKYIQAHNSYLAHAIVYMCGVKFYKITIENKVVYSFIYTEELLKLFTTLETLKNIGV